MRRRSAGVLIASKVVVLDVMLATTSFLLVPWILSLPCVLLQRNVTSTWPFIPPVKPRNRPRPELVLAPRCKLRCQRAHATLVRLFNRLRPADLTEKHETKQRYVKVGH